MSVVKCIETTKGKIMYNIYDFLEEIRKRPLIWDRSDPRKNIIKDKCWIDLCRNLIPFFDDLDKEERISIDKKVKTVWKACVTVLMKSYHKKDIDPNYQINRYARSMEFYLNYRGINLEDIATENELAVLDEIEITKKKTYEEQISKLNGNNKKKVSNFNDIGIIDSEQLMAPIDDSSCNPMLFCETTTREDNENYDEQNINVEAYHGEQQNTNSNGSITVDTDQAFFDSLKPSLRTLNEVQNLDFKIECLKILKKCSN